jgi:uncharacterized damage-inducible protein DinB
VFCAVHGAHHPGQLAAYQGQMGGKIPAFYDSTDEPYNT